MNLEFAKVFKKRQANGVIGVEFNADGVALAYLTNTLAAVPTVEHIEFISCDKDADRSALLATRIKELGLQNTPCRFVLSRGSYQFLLVEAPKVPAAELNEALRWRIKDLLSFPAANAVIDAFLLPQDSARGGSPMAYAAVTESTVIQSVVDAMAAASLELQSIDIPELCLRNLAIRAADSQRSLAIVHMVQGAGALEIIRNNQLYLSRQFDLAYNAGLLDDLPEDALALELQRSLDYYERQMRQVPPKDILFCGENISPDKLTDTFKQALSASLHVLELESQITLADVQQAHLLPLCLLALGAALQDSTEQHGCVEVVA